MQVSVISFTKNGLELSKKIEKAFGDWQIKLYTKYKIEGLENSSSISYVSQGISEWAGEQMGQKNALVFIGACGIAVRAIASYVKDKLQDSPVLVMDEQGNYVIPLLSGHIGGANDIANILAERLQATPVITTATDVNRRFAVDLFAQKNGLKIVNKDGIAKISSKILDGKTITVAIEEGHWDGVGIVPEQIEIVDLDSEIEKDIVIKTENEMDKAELILQPKEYIIGIGCKRGKEEDKQGYFMTKGNKIRAHEFHYYDSTNNGEACMATKPVTGKQYPCIMTGKNFRWGFPHLYYPSNPTFARHFVEEVVAYKKKTEKR